MTYDIIYIIFINFTKGKKIFQKLQLNYFLLFYNNHQITFFPFNNNEAKPTFFYILGSTMNNISGSHTRTHINIS